MPEAETLRRQEAWMEPAQVAAVAAGTFAVALLAGLIPVLGWGGGGERALGPLTGVAAGVLLASALLVALPEGFALAVASETPGMLPAPFAGGGAVLLGFLAMLVLEGLGLGHDVHEEHHDHAEHHGHDHVLHPQAPLLVVIGLSVHALADGLALGAGLASGSPVLALSLLFAVSMHKVPAALSLTVFSLHERRSARRALFDLLLFSLATPVAVVLGYLAFGGLSREWLGLAVLLAAGTFLYVATVDVLPDVHAAETGGTALWRVLTGALAMALALLAFQALGLADLHG